MIESKIHIEPLSPGQIPPAFAEAEDESRRLVKLATDHLGADGARYALIHLDDGVLWGRADGDKLTVPDPGDWTPKLRTVTVQQCRVFGDKGELFIWREAEGQWRGRVVVEEDKKYDSIVETQILNGSRVYRNDTDQERRVWATVPDGFTPIIEIDTGLRQIVPIKVSEQDFEKGKRAILTVCHYLAPDEDGQARFFCSRLKSIETGRPDKNAR